MGNYWVGCATKFTCAWPNTKM